MDVTVAFTTQLKAALGKPNHNITLDADATAQDAIDALSALHPEPFAQLVLADGQLIPSILLSVNDQQVDANAKLSDGDVLTLLSAISGG